MMMMMMMWMMIDGVVAKHSRRSYKPPKCTVCPWIIDLRLRDRVQ